MQFAGQMVFCTHPQQLAHRCKLRFNWICYKYKMHNISILAVSEVGLWICNRKSRSQVSSFDPGIMFRNTRSCHGVSRTCLF